jgi:ribokinase
MAGAIGDDDFGRFLLNRLGASGVDNSRVVKLPDVGSGMSVAISDAGGDYGAVIVSGSNLHIRETDVADPGLWADAQALILQNEVPEAINLAAARAAKAAGARVCLNAAPARALPPELASHVDVLIVNAIEAEALCGVAVRDLTSAAAAAQQLSLQFASVVVTAGGDGVAGSENGSPAVQVLARPVTLVSTHGAGDVFVGSFVASWARGQGFSRSIGVANEAAAAHVSAQPES